MWVATSSISYWSADNQEDGYVKNKCYEACRIDLYSLKNDKITHLVQRSFSHNGGKAGIDPSQEHFTLYERNPNLNFRTIYRFNIMQQHYQTPNQIGAVIDFVDSLSVSGVVYKDILHYYYPTTVPQYDYLKEVYYVKHVGILKYTSSGDNSNWELIRYKIIQ